MMFHGGWDRVGRVAALALLLGAPTGLAMELPLEPPPSEDLALWRRKTDTVIARIAVEAPTLDPAVLRLALDARSCARQQGDPAGRASIMTIIDYSRPSSAQRLWVVDADRGRVLFHERVSHGKNSGEDLTTSFSNVKDSLQTSLGLFRTAETYVGQNGYSLRLDGLEPGFNDRARERDIVVHGAEYNSDAHVAEFGRLGRSWGCPALPNSVARPLIDEIKEGTLLFSYYPDPAWLSSSAYLHCSP